MNRIVGEVTDRISKRSKESREGYLRRVDEARRNRPQRHFLPCSNLAHGLAVCSSSENNIMRNSDAPNIAIITAYNDMLSAHKTYETYPQLLKKSVAGAGGVAQVAGAVPAMCDGITQGEAGMDLSLISRDVIALSVVIALSHNLFDGALLLGICDKIMPGLLMGALQFGHLPMILVPGGPMPTGIANREKARARERFSRDLHLLRHSQQQPAAGRGDGPASARSLFCQSRHPIAGCLYQGSGKAGCRAYFSRQQLHTHCPCGQ
jgi:phosphogluconate dehydratase